MRKAGKIVDKGLSEPRCKHCGDLFGRNVMGTVLVKEHLLRVHNIMVINQDYSRHFL